MKLKTIMLFVLTLFLSSCSSYMNAIYKDFEDQEKSNPEIDAQDSTFDQYRKNTKRKTSTEYNQPSKIVNTANQKTLEPGVKRQYKDEKVALKRYTASDLTDNGSDGSLWAGNDPNAFLFSSNRTKTSGDIVQINVGNKLKDEITMELKRSFPDNPYEAKANGKDEKGAPSTNEKKPASAEASTGADVKDKISSVVVEEINREHLLIKGRKNVLFKNRKRMVEVQALVSRKDIGDDDTVNSDSILESSISVVR
jgi:flagellar L-ring protein precursor FlgH